MTNSRAGDVSDNHSLHDDHDMNSDDGISLNSSIATGAFTDHHLRLLYDDSQQQQQQQPTTEIYMEALKGSGGVGGILTTTGSGGGGGGITTWSVCAESKEDSSCTHNNNNNNNTNRCGDSRSSSAAAGSSESEMSSIGMSSVVAESNRSSNNSQQQQCNNDSWDNNSSGHTNNSHHEQLARIHALVSSHQRRAQRRQWNPSNHRYRNHYYTSHHTVLQPPSSTTITTLSSSYWDTQQQQHFQEHRFQTIEADVQPHHLYSNYDTTTSSATANSRTIMPEATIPPDTMKTTARTATTHSSSYTEGLDRVSETSTTSPMQSIHHMTASTPTGTGATTNDEDANGIVVETGIVVNMSTLSPPQTQQPPHDTSSASSLPVSASVIDVENPISILPPSPPSPPSPRQTTTNATRSNAPRHNGNNNGTTQNNNNNDPAASTNTTQATLFTHLAASDSKYEEYSCLVDASRNDRALELQIYSMARPHMRAFHISWMTFFVAFLAWFSITPLLGEIKDTLSLTRRQIWTSSTFGVAGSAITRVVIGPLCDAFGARWIMTGTLIVSAIPTAMTGLVNSASGLYALRLFIGIAGSAFVTCQYWTCSVFTEEVTGTANALVAGWGNLGGGVTQIMMGSLLFPLFKFMYGGDSINNNNNNNQTNTDTTTIDLTQGDRASELSWRTVCIVPALLCIVTAYVCFFKSDDCPKGNYRDMRSSRPTSGLMSVPKSLTTAMLNHNTWILFIQYGCCFGVEITMVNATALYFHEVFGQSTESAAAIASIFGWMNLFARGMGGFSSDYSFAKYGMPGRLWVQVVALLLEGVLIVSFGQMRSLGGAIAMMILLSIAVCISEGSTFGIMPYVQHGVTGSVAGLIGAGGNVGGVIFSLIFREYDYEQAFLIMGIIAMTSAILSLGLMFPNHASLFWGSDSDSIIQRRVDHMETFGTYPQVLTSTTMMMDHHHHRGTATSILLHSMEQDLSHASKESSIKSNSITSSAAASGGGASLDIKSVHSSSFVTMTLPSSV